MREFTGDGPDDRFSASRPGNAPSDAQGADMTMPRERTQSLRFGWEFLMELQASDNLTVDQRSTIEKILLHYPTGGEIKKLAKDCAGAMIAPEDPNVFSSRNSAIPDSIPRGPT